jgi:hypothetical protein
MPVTARLSSRFYERIGDEATNELVNWLNDVDAEFRSQLRETNDRNWDRFRDQLESTKTELRAEIKTECAAVRAEMHAMKSELIKWMFTFWVVSWIATVVPIAGLILQTR